MHKSKSRVLRYYQMKKKKTTAAASASAKKNDVFRRNWVEEARNSQDIRLPKTATSVITGV